MKFDKFFRANLIPEWQNSYVNYSLLKEVIIQLEGYPSRFVLNLGCTKISNFDEAESKEIEGIIEIFKKLLLLQFHHFNQCFKHHFQMNVKQKLVRIMWNFAAIEADPRLKEDLKISEQIEKSMEKYYKEISVLRAFVDLNLRVIYKILKKFRRLLSLVHRNEEEFIVNFNKKLVKSFVYRKSPAFLKTIKITEETYFQKCLKQEGSIQAKKRLKQIAKSGTISGRDLCIAGFFSGMTAISLLVIIFQMVQTEFFELGPNDNFLKYQMSLFRGSLIAFLYIFFWGVNVFIFERFNINFTRVLMMHLHYSSACQVWNRSFGFLFIWMLCFLYCSISNYMDNNAKQDPEYVGGPLSYFFNEHASTFIALLPYLAFLAYIFFPRQRFFNWKGRKWFLVLCLNIIRSPFYDFPFIVTWATDQMLSLTVSLRDLWYSVCYLISSCSDGTMVNTCRSGSIYAIEYIVIFIPLCLRILQCMNRIYFSQTKKEKIIHLANCLKYFSSVTSTIFSFFNSDPSIFILWIIAVVISSLYSFFWDLKYDWCFLQRGSKNLLLRSELSYSNRSFYYFAIGANLVMRFMWTLSINSLSIFKTQVLQNLLSIGLGIVEIVRRSLWNYFRVEVEHLKTIGNFSIFQEDYLPLKFNIDTQDISLRRVMDEEFKRIIFDSDSKYKRELLTDRKIELSNLEELGSQFVKFNQISSTIGSSMNSLFEEPQQMERENQQYLKDLESAKNQIPQKREFKVITNLKVHLDDNEKKSGDLDQRDLFLPVPTVDFNRNAQTFFSFKEHHSLKKIEDSSQPQRDPKDPKEFKEDLDDPKDPPLPTAKAPYTQQRSTSDLLKELPPKILKSFYTNPKLKPYAMDSKGGKAEPKRLENFEIYREKTQEPQVLLVKSQGTLKSALRHLSEDSRHRTSILVKQNVRFSEPAIEPSSPETE